MLGVLRGANPAVRCYRPVLLREFWIVDVKYRHRDGRIERVRKVPRRQTRAAADKLEREILDALENGKAYQEEEADVPTLGQFAKDFMKVYASVNNKASEKHTKGVLLRLHLLPALGNSRLDRIGTRDVEKYKARKLSEGLAPKTINNHLAVLRRILRVAVEWEVINSCTPIRPLKVKQPEVRFLSFADAQSLVDAVEDSWRAMVVVALNTGLRQGELLALRWEHIDLSTGRLVVRDNDWKGQIGTPKGGRNREIPLNKAARAALMAHRHGRGPLVFCHTDGSRLTYHQCRYPLQRACLKAGIPQVQWHALRHTFASHLVMRGVPL